MSDDYDAVWRVTEKYMYALDRLHGDPLLEVFIDDAELLYLGGEGRMVGGAEFFEQTALSMTVFSVTNHALNSFDAAISGDTATADYMAVATLARADNGVVLVRGISYVDRLVKIDSRWRVTWRKHTPRWEYNLDSAAIDLPRGAA